MIDHSCAHAVGVCQPNRPTSPHSLPSPSQKVHKKPVARLSRRMLPKTVPYVVRCVLISGSELPAFRKNVAAGLSSKNRCADPYSHSRVVPAGDVVCMCACACRSVGVQICIGRYVLEFERATNKDGLAYWGQVKEQGKAVSKLRPLASLCCPCQPTHCHSTTIIISHCLASGHASSAGLFHLPIPWQRP